MGDGRFDDNGISSGMHFEIQGYDNEEDKGRNENYNLLTNQELFNDVQKIESNQFKKFQTMNKLGEEDIGDENFELNMNQLEVRSMKSNSHSKNETPTKNFQINYDKL